MKLKDMANHYDGIAGKVREELALDELEEVKTHIVDEREAIKDYEEFKDTICNEKNVSVLETYYILCGYLIGMNISGIISDNTYNLLITSLKKNI